MPYYRRVGDVPHKRHTIHHVDGAMAFEELMGTEGFSGISSLLYHRHSPSAIVRIEPVEAAEPAFRANMPLRPHHLRTTSLERTDAMPGDVVRDAVLGRRALLGNENVSISFVAASQTSALYRNATGDELVYVQSGAAVLESVFGRLAVGPGDYIVVPMSTTHRWIVDSVEPAELLIIAARGHITVPSRYTNSSGQLIEGSPFSERDLRGPAADPVIEVGEDVEVLVRTRAGLSRHVHATHPFDVVGWDGCLYPWAFNIADFEPIVGRIHQPPPVHQTFAGAGFVVCSFVPRLFDFDPSAVKVPYHHANVDTDEVLFYSAGDFMSRAGSGIGVGSISVHPAGFIHGPQPGSHERTIGVDRTEETAVMLDAFSPLGLSDDALAISDPEYPWSWAGGPQTDRA
jgi:homogentisate 1,2-dioxygenase